MRTKRLAICWLNHPRRRFAQSLMARSLPNDVGSTAMHDVLIVYHDGGSKYWGIGYETLGDALKIALDLADDLGRDLLLSDPHRPRWVEIRTGEQMEISVSILPGGLLGEDTAPAVP